jgi:molybdopterin-containing oxidoreductase family membrane subunit
MKAHKNLFWLAVAALAIGVIGLGDRLLFGHRDAAYGSYVVWGLWVSMYLFFAGVSAGAFAIGTLDLLFKVEVFKGTGRIALWTALVSLGGALLSIWLDLGHLVRIWRVYFQPHFGSVMTQMVWGYTLFGLLLVLALREAIRDPESRLLRALLVAGIPLSLFIAGAVGALLGVNPSRPFWHIGLLPVQFPVFAVASGFAALLTILGLLSHGEDPRRAAQLQVLAVGTIAFGVVKLFFVWADFSQSLYGNVPQNVAAVNEVLYGPHWWAFWILQIGLGTLVPIAVLASPRRARNGAVAGWMGVLTLGGLAVARANIVLPALAVPEIDALATAFSGSPRLRFEYFPSLMEWAVTLGITGLVVLAFLVGSERLPLRSKEVA